MREETRLERHVLSTALLRISIFPDNSFGFAFATSATRTNARRRSTTAGPYSSTERFCTDDLCAGDCFFLVPAN